MPEMSDEALLSLQPAGAKGLTELNWLLIILILVSLFGATENEWTKTEVIILLLFYEAAWLINK